MHLNRFGRIAAVAAGGVVSASGMAQGQIAVGPHTIRLQTVASGLTAPVQAKAPPDGTDRLFVVDQAGLVRVIEHGALLPAPFLDVRPLLVPLFAPYDERGLLGLAFHPDFAQNGRFFVHYTIRRTGAPGDACFSDQTFGCSSEVIAEYRVSADPNVADAGSGVVLLTVPKPQFNHAGGGLEFGPDGLLYIALGDGGGANDGLADNPPSHGPGGNAQNLAVPLGKVLRYDVSTPGVLTIPPTNPYFGDDTKFQGIYASGLRNPYAFSFDDGPGGTGRLVLADVGQDAFEEVDYLELGGNYQWPIKEGFHCFDPFATHSPPPSCPAADGLQEPVLEYPHADASGPVGLAAIAGYVYRGPRMPSMHGWFIFGDFSTSFGAPDGHLFTFDTAAANPTLYRLKIGDANSTLSRYVKGFGRDRNGEIYLLSTTNLGPSGTSGTVARFVPCPGDFNGDGFIDFFDFNDFVDAFENGLPSADFNGDGFIDFFDFNDFVDAFGGPC